MTEEEFFRDLLESYRDRFERGDYTAAVQAVRLCGGNSLVMPDWVAHEAGIAIEMHFRSGGAQGGGRGGGFLSQYRRERVHELRHQIAEHELARRKLVGGNRGEAFERASERLQGTKAQGSPDAIEASFNRIQAKYRPG